MWVGRSSPDGLWNVCCSFLLPACRPVSRQTLDLHCSLISKIAFISTLHTPDWSRALHFVSIPCAMGTITEDVDGTTFIPWLAVLWEQWKLAPPWQNKFRCYSIFCAFSVICWVLLCVYMHLQPYLLKLYHWVKKKKSFNKNRRTIGGKLSELQSLFLISFFSFTCNCHE